MRKNFLISIKRKQRKGIRAEVRSDITHNNLFDANQYNEIKRDFRFYYHSRKPDPKKNLRNNSTKKRHLIRKLRVSKSIR